ncbi:hypothetical protein HOY82DRAFT_633202 [Tuber indicum]|nr:hypothetical protein HOY82DRAFT_633202 [Tuber indicum]
MLKFKNKLPKWMAVSRGDNTEGSGGNRKSASLELLTIGSKSIRGRWISFSSIWKPVWYTGWHSGVLTCAASVVIVLFINISLTIYAATNPEYKMEGGVGTLYSGSCDKSKTIGMWLHLGINVLSTLLLSGSNYTQQCLAAPTRSEIDAAHAKRRWMDIGVPSVRNLFLIKSERVFLWIAIGITSIPLHLLYNSAVYNSIAANNFVITLVTENHFETGSYSNKTKAVLDFYQEFKNITNRSPHSISDVQLYSSVLEQYSTRSQDYESLTPSKCVKLYNTDFVSNRRNLFLITNHTYNTIHNNTVLSMTKVEGNMTWSNRWICSGYYHYRGRHAPSAFCDPNETASNTTRGLPWVMYSRLSGEVVIRGCKSERTRGNCKVQFSLWIMIVIICCNLIKACGMVMTVSRSREPTLVTLGDAVDSFLRTPDPTTMGMCFADRRFVEMEWSQEQRSGTRQWRHIGAQRWWTSVSKTRWITCNIFCLIIIIAAGVLLRMGINNERNLWSTDIKGFGKVNTGSLLTLDFGNITHTILLVNLPQTILSFLYLTYNSLFTCMLLGHEWSLFSHHHRSLRVTSPRPGQRSTYWLQLPYIYAIPLMILSGLLHWLTSQSIFLAKLEIWDPLGKEISSMISTAGYSCIAIISVLLLGILALLTAAGMGYRRFAAETTTVGSCSAAISAACHALEDPDVILGKKVRWGDVGILHNLGVRHLTFSSKEVVKKPIFGEVYAGSGRGGGDRL